LAARISPSSTPDAIFIRLAVELKLYISASSAPLSMVCRSASACACASAGLPVRSAARPWA
jgi:hypothetical protein